MELQNLLRKYDKKKREYRLIGLLIMMISLAVCILTIRLLGIVQSLNENSIEYVKMLVCLVVSLIATGCFIVSSVMLLVKGWPSIQDKMLLILVKNAIGTIDNLKCKDL